MGESSGPGSSVSQAGWAGTGWSPKAEQLHLGLFKAWRARDPKEAEVSFVPRVYVTQVAVPAQRAGSQEPAGNHDARAGRPHPGLAVPLTRPFSPCWHSAASSAAARPLDRT